MAFFSAIGSGFWPSHRRSSFAAKAKRDMRFVKVPSYAWDIFKFSKIELAKAAFSDTLKKEAGPGVTLYFLQSEIQLTLEGYFVDKYLSSRIPTPFMDALILRIEQAVTSEPKLFQIPKDSSCTNRTGFFTGVIQRFASIQCPTNFRELYPEVCFMMRVAERLRIQEEAKLFQEIPFPGLSKESSEYLQIGMKEAETGSQYFSIPVRNRDISEKDSEIFDTYCKTLFDTRNQRMLNIIKEAWAKDRQAREKDPNAPLIHFVTLDRYEMEIYQKRKRLYLQTAAAVVVTVVLFFLQRGPRSYRELSKAFKTQLLFFLFSLQKKIL